MTLFIVDEDETVLVCHLEKCGVFYTIPGSVDLNYHQPHDEVGFVNMILGTVGCPLYPITYRGVLITF